jgi:histidine ammonia-lyase
MTGETKTSVTVNGYSLSVADVVAMAGGARIAVADDAWERVDLGRSVVDEVVAARRPTYGINTGVGSQKDYTLSEHEIEQFNRRLLTAHATSVPGPVLDHATVRAAMGVQANLFASGACGVRRSLLELVVGRLNRDIIPRVDAAGSVGASDLVPLAQIALALMQPQVGEAPFVPAAKEALSLMNSNAVSLGRGALALDDARRLLAAFDLAAAAALEGLRANLDAISPPITRVHELQGRARSANRIRALLAGSRLWRPGEARFLQDPLSFRSVSQVNSAAETILSGVWRTWETELNTITDNPMIDLETRRPISHGNMDTSALTLALDSLRQALAKVADLSGERLHKQHWPAFSGLPVGLAERDSAVGGVQFLNLGHIAASLIASMKIWSQPILGQSIGQLADGVEDTAGLALHAVWDTAKLLEAGWKVATLEAMVACWAIRRRGLATSQLGAGVRPLVEVLTPHLPIGREGEARFDIAPLIDLMRGPLLETCLDAVDLATEGESKLENAELAIPETAEAAAKV